MAKKIIGIYIITSPTSKVYVGQSCDIKKRLINHKCKCKSKKEYYIKHTLYTSLRHYGWENHNIEIVKIMNDGYSQIELDCAEQYYMDYFRDKSIQLMNHKEAGANGRPSEETRKRMSVANMGNTHAKGKSPSLEVRKVMRERKINTKKLGSSSAYVGVFYLKKKKRPSRWRAEVNVDGKKVQVGYFKTEDLAIVARQGFVDKLNCKNKKVL